MSIILFMALLPYIAQCGVIKSVELTASNTKANGAEITSSNIDGQIANDLFTISVTTQQGYSWMIDLDETWGFHPNQLSTISLTISSPATSNTETCDGFITALTNNSNSYQYITHWMAFDLAEAGAGENWIYPTCDTNVPPTQSFATDDVISCVEHNICSGTNTANRVTKVTGGLLWNSNSPILPANTIHRNSWPLVISLTNDPINNVAFTTINTPSWDGWTQGCGYGQIFATNVGLQIYISLDKSGEYVEFDTFSIEYTVNGITTSAEPTDTPSAEPTEASQDPTTATHEPTSVSHEPTTASHEPTTESHEPTTASQMPSKHPSTKQATSSNPTLSPIATATTTNIVTASSSTEQESLDTTSTLGSNASEREPNNTAIWVIIVSSSLMAAVLFVLVFSIFRGYMVLQKEKRMNAWMEQEIPKQNDKQQQRKQTNEGNAFTAFDKKNSMKLEVAKIISAHATHNVVEGHNVVGEEHNYEDGVLREEGEEHNVVEGPNSQQNQNDVTQENTQIVRVVSDTADTANVVGIVDEYYHDV